METFVLIGVGVLAVLYLRNQSAAAASQLPPTPAIGAGLVPTMTPGTLPPFAAPIGASAPISSGYQTVAASTQLRTGETFVSGPNGQNFSVVNGRVYTALATSRQLGPVSPQTAPPPPPPYVAGGIAGGVGTGGNPLGGVVRPGVSSGTGTTAFPSVLPPSITPGRLVLA